MWDKIPSNRVHKALRWNLSSSLAIFLWLSGCASTGQQLKDPDQGAVCHAADGEGVVLVRCGRFAMAIVDVDETLSEDAVVKVYRSVVEESVSHEVLVQDAPLRAAGTAYAGFKWETPDQVAPRSGRVLVGEVNGQRRVITCEVRDAGKTAEERCQARLTNLLTDGHEALPRVSVTDLQQGKRR